MTHSQRLQANIVAAQCVDLGLSHIQVLDEGEVQARLGPCIYTFRWNVTHQCVDLISVQDDAPVYRIVA
jgi:hypothetical protein